MCEPVTLASAASYASLAIGAAGVITEYVGGQQQANKQSAAQAQYYADTQAESQRAFATQVNQENARLGEQSASNSKELTQVAMDKRKAQATARVAAGEAGVSGISLEALLRDYDRTEANFRDSTKQQTEFDQLAARDRIEGFDSQRRSRNNAAKPQPVARPSFLGAALRIGGFATDHINSRHDNRSKK